MTAVARATCRSTTERALLWLEALLALGAYGGAIGLLSGGIDLGASTADLPFGSTVFAGTALGAVNGLLPTVVLFGALRRKPWARAGHWAVGAALSAWIVVQVSFLGWPPHWLQILYLGYGLAILALAHRLTRADAPSGPSPRGGPPRKVPVSRSQSRLFPLSR